MLSPFPPDPASEDADRAAMVSAAIGQAAVAVIVCDIRFSPYFLNAAARSLFGIRDDFALGDPDPGWLWDGAAIDAAIVGAVIERDGSWRGSRALVAAGSAPGQSRETDIDISPFRDGEAAGFVIVARATEPRTPIARRASDIDLIAASRRLTGREKEVMLGLLEGLPNKSIGLRMAISPRTVEFHRARLMHRFGAKSAIELIQKVLHDDRSTSLMEER